jgi:hypothetical protein
MKELILRPDVGVMGSYYGLRAVHTCLWGGERGNVSQYTQLLNRRVDKNIHVIIPVDPLAADLFGYTRY